MYSIPLIAENRRLDTPGTAAVQTDDTPVAALDRKLTRTKKGRLWA